MATVRALVLHEEAGKIVPRIEAVDETRLPPGEVTVRVECSTLNYKDGMILEGVGRLVRTYPHIPGIDFAGTVEASQAPQFKPGDPVILTGWRVGEARWGGYAEKARVNASFLVRRPDGLSARQAMAIGTAGFTAMLAVIAL
jgi:acrylyl-CoA reductase (NADPH)